MRIGKKLIFSFCSEHTALHLLFFQIFTFYDDKVNTK